MDCSNELIQRVASELNTLIDAESSLQSFVEYTIPNYIEGCHINRITEALQRVAEGECKRLLIVMPPRHGKSETASVRFPAWYLCNNPQKQIIACSYSADLAQTFSDAVRRVIQSDRCRRIWDYDMNKDTSKKWQFTIKSNNRANYISAGVGGGITGEGGDCILVDDPLKNMEEANSRTIRDKIWEWYQSTLYTRLHPGGSIVLIMTRWHHDDLAGRLLKQMHDNPNSDQWEVLHLRAISDEGKALWPERYPLEELHRIRESIGERMFNALYQGMPSTEEGNILKREWWQFYDSLKEGDTIQSWDTAYKTGQENDYSVCWTLRKCDTGIYAVDMLRGKWEYPEMKRIAVQHYHQHKPSIVLIEDHASGQTLIQDLRRSTDIPIKPIRADRDKVSRVNAIANVIEGGRLFLPSQHDWTATAIEECAAFPSGEHDDIVDALAQGIAYFTVDATMDVLSPAGTTEGLFQSGMKPPSQRRASLW